MKASVISILITAFSIACSDKIKNELPHSTPVPIKGTWQLVTGILVEKGDTAVTDYTKKISFIKIINDTHFAFLQHDLNKGKDSLPVFASGGGKYSLKGNSYTEHLEYCSDRAWEGNNFEFTVSLQNDTLTQTGVEKVESAGVNRVNTEKYMRLKD